MFLLLLIIYIVGYMLLSVLVAAAACVLAIALLAYLLAFSVRMVYGKIKGEENPPGWAMHFPPFDSYTGERAKAFAKYSGITFAILSVVGFITYCFVVTS